MAKSTSAMLLGLSIGLARLSPNSWLHVPIAEIILNFDVVLGMLVKFELAPPSVQQMKVAYLKQFLASRLISTEVWFESNL